MLKGYLNPGYAESLREFGTPLELPRCGGAILERDIPGTPYRDAMGCYPLFMCRDWSQVVHDLENIGDDLVSLAMVTDPFGNYTERDLHQYFNVVYPFKKHFIADLHLPINEIVSRHHRYYAKKVLQKVHIDISEEPIQYLDEWVGIFNEFVNRQKISGIKAFSRLSFTKQLEIPGLVMFRAIYDNQVAGIALCYTQDDVGYGHLLGTSEIGHAMGVTYGLYWSHLTYLSGKVRWLDWGGSSGVQEDSTDGLSQFKRGWSSGTRTAYFCGKIMNPKIYTTLVENSGMSHTTYFPAYRSGEFR